LLLSYRIAEAHLILASLRPKVLADSKKKDLVVGMLFPLLLLLIVKKKKPLPLE
jgi:hypothetical protein